MAQKIFKAKKRKPTPKKTAAKGEAGIVLVGTYKAGQLDWIGRHGLYNYPAKEGDGFDAAAMGAVGELWLYADAKGTRHCYAAEYVGKVTREEWLKENPSYPKGKVKGQRSEVKGSGEKVKVGGQGQGKHTAYYVFRTRPHEYGALRDGQFVVARADDFAKGRGQTQKIKQALERYKQDGEFAPLAAYLPQDLAQVPKEQLRVCEPCLQADFLKVLNVKVVVPARREKNSVGRCADVRPLCPTIFDYSRIVAKAFSQRDLFAGVRRKTARGDIRVVELFAGVGGFRVGLERASDRFKTVWNNQWEPSTKRQDASNVYQLRFGPEGHCNEDIATVPVTEIPEADLLVGGFPCQDYSVATTLKNSGGIEGKKGVLWWQIHRILRDKGDAAPKYLMLENVDRLLKSPATQRGRDFAIILASLADLGYCVEWRVINAADYGMPQRRRRTYILAYRNGTALAEGARRALRNPLDWITQKSVEAQAFDSKAEDQKCKEFDIEGSLADVTKKFNVSFAKTSPFCDAGFMVDRHVCTVDVDSVYAGIRITLGELVEQDDSKVPEAFFVKDAELKEWQYLKGPKSEERMSVDKDGNAFTYHYSEGGMAFPDALDKPSRTIITGEGGAGASRFKHIIKTKSGRYRRLMPLELERLNMFPDNHTEGASDMRRAFLMGNALVTGIVERIGIILKECI